LRQSTAKPFFATFTAHRALNFEKVRNFEEI